MTAETVLTDMEIVLVCSAYAPSEDVSLSRAIEQAVLQSPEIQRLRTIEKAAQEVLDQTQLSQRPPVREWLPMGTMVRVRVHALADLHDALHPDDPAKTEPSPLPNKDES